MRTFIALIIIVYLVGIGVVLSPVVRANWQSESASEFAGTLADALPDALAWPARVVQAARS